MMKYFVIWDFRGACSSVEMLKGYMLICQNAEGVHDKQKVGSPCPAQLRSFHMPSFQLCRSTGQKRQNWYDLADYTSETIWLGVNMYGGSYVVNLFKQKIVSQRIIFLLPWHYTTIFFVIHSLTIFTAQIVHSLMYYCGKICLRSLADQIVHRLQKMFLTEIHAKATRTALLDWNFAMGASE